MTDIKEGYFVQFNGRLCSIIAMVNGIAKLSNGQEVAYDLLYPVKTGDPLDRQITLVCDNMRYPAGDVKTEPIKYYQDCYLSQGKTIKDVLNENPSIKHLHELQDWLLKNSEDFHLINKYGQLINNSRYE
jgi:hypothetical protein